MIKNRITLGNHISVSWTIALYLIAAVVYPIYMTDRFGSDDQQFFIQSAVVFFLIFFTPQILIHINYFVINKGGIFAIDKSTNDMSFEQDGNIKKFNINDIKRVTQYRSLPFSENRMQWFPWDSYNYSVIELEGGEKILITSLLVYKLELELDEDKIVLKKRFYCWAHPH